MINQEKLYSNGPDGIFISIRIPAQKLNLVLEDAVALEALVDAYLVQGKRGFLSFIDSCREE